MANRPGRKIDWITFSLYLTLVAVGWLMIYTVGYKQDYSRGIVHFFSNTLVGKQTIFIAVSLAMFVVLFLVFDRKFWQTFAYAIYGGALALLVAVLIFGKEINGSTSWFAIGGFTFQPSEVAKFATALALAAFLATYRISLKKRQHQLMALGIAFLPAGLIMLQPDAGSAIVFTSLLVVLFREGFPSIYYILGFASAGLIILGIVFDAKLLITAMAALGILIFLSNYNRRIFWILGWSWLVAGSYYLWTLPENPKQNLVLGVFLAAFLAFAILGFFRKYARQAIVVSASLVLGSALIFAANFSFNNVLKPHQQQRIDVWLRPSKVEDKGSSYNLELSKIAIGSGGLAGKGFLQGSLTKGSFVPEQSTDFIFCTIGEEQGFIGSIAILVLFMALILRITLLAERQRDTFSRSYAYGVAGILFIHLVINMGMTMGLLPIIGIPLPFISAGGSSMLGFSLLISILLKLDSSRYSL